MSNPDPWAAQQAQATGATTTAPPANSAPAAGNLGGSFQDGKSQLFNTGSVAPSLLNKTHGLNTERTGVITKLPYDRQSVDYNTKRPKFWEDGNSGKGQKPVDYPVSKVTGRPNRPVMDTFLELETNYTMDAAEASAVGREGPYEGTERVFVAGGADLKALQDAIADANKRGLRIASEQDMVGKRITVKRVGQKPNESGNPSWILAIRLDAA
jgi:hypothetical protein